MKCVPRRGGRVYAWETEGSRDWSTLQEGNAVGEEGREVASGQTRWSLGSQGKAFGFYFTVMGNKQKISSRRVPCSVKAFQSPVWPL